MSDEIVQLQEPKDDGIRERFVVPQNTLYLHPRQMEVYNSTARFKVVVAGRRWGKSELAKTSLIKFARKPKRLVWYVAPSYRIETDHVANSR